MRRVFIIARSDPPRWSARADLIGIMLMPLLFGGAILLQRPVERQANSTMLRVAIIDDTGRLFRAAPAAAAAWNRGERDLGPDVPDGPRFAVERMEAGASRRTTGSPCRNGYEEELFAFVELPARCSDRNHTENPLLLRARRRIASCPTGYSGPS